MNIPHSQELVQALKALGHPDRIKIVCAIFNNSHNVTDIGALSGILQPSLSAHLKVLHIAGIITKRKEGKEVFYTIDNPKYRSLMQSISTIWCDDS